LLVLGLDAIWGYLYSPVAYVAQGVVGALMLLYGIFAPGDTGKERTTQLPRSQSLGAIFLLGITITVVAFSTALPYLGAIALLTNADLTAVQWVLIVYNLIFVLPPFLLLVSHWLLGSRLQRRFDRYRQRVWRGSRGTWLWIIAIVGFVLLSRSRRCRRAHESPFRDGRTQRFLLAGDRGSTRESRRGYAVVSGVGRLCAPLPPVILAHLHFPASPLSKHV
jgi:hypothetical protein